MHHISLLFALLGWAQDPAGQPAHTPPAPADVAETDEAIVVTGRRGEPEPKLEPIAYFREHCFEANRLTRRPAPPERDRNWEPLDEETRAKAGITDPAVAAYSLIDETRGHTLVMKFERLSTPPGLTEHRCSLTILGGRAHETIEDEASALFGGPTTRRHVGHPSGVPKIEGWQQRLWTGMPNRRSKAWRMRGYIVVLQPSFYDEYSYIVGDLKMKEDAGASVSVLTFAHTYKGKQVSGS